jgi:hypothetical protein
MAHRTVEGTFERRLYSHPRMSERKSVPRGSCREDVERDLSDRVLPQIDCESVEG